MSDLQHFHLASPHGPIVSYTYCTYYCQRKASPKKRAENIFAAMKKRRPPKAVFDRNKINMESEIIDMKERKRGKRTLLAF